MVRAAAIAIAAVLSCAPFPASAGVFNPETFTLGNGMRVVVIPNHRLPVVTHMVWYRVGSADEPPGKSGIAHLLEHMMFKGTDAVAPGEFSKIVARNGGRDNAFTSSDYTGYYQNIAADRLELVMKLEADRMAHMKMDPDIFRTEHQVVREERRTRTDNEPESLLGERLDAALWLLHPYKNPVIGWDSELRMLTRDDAVTFYRRWYSPDNAVLVVAGDVTTARVRELADRHFGPLPARGEPGRTRVRDLPPRADAVITMRHPHVEQPSWTRVYVAPSYAVPQGKPVHPYALQVLAELFGGGSTSRLYQSLVVKQKLASSAYASYNPTAVDFGQLSLSASPREGVGMSQVEAAVQAEIDRLTGDGVTLDEVARAKARMRAAAVYARDSLQTGAQVLGYALVVGQNVEDVEEWPERIGAVTAADVTEAARLVLTRSQNATGILLPDPGERDKK